MKNKIKILHVDDNSLDRQLVKDALCKEHDAYELIEADSREKFEKHLAENDFDLILSDFNILGFDGLQVLKIVQEKDPSIPVIIVTGTGSEEIAIQAMKMGASDYVIKSAKHIQGLAPTIEHVLENKRLQNENNETLEALKINEKKYRLLFESNPHPMWVYELESLRFLEANQAAIVKYGYSRKEFLSMNLKDIRPPEDIEILLENIRAGADEFSFSGEWRHKNRNGDIFLVEIISHSIKYNEKNARLVLVNDITERKKTEDKLKLYIRAIEQSSVSLNITDSQGDIIYVNSGFTALSGYSSAEVIGRNPRFLKSGIHSNDFYRELWDTLLAGKNWTGELCNQNKEGNLYWVQATISPVVDSKGKITHFVAIKEDITEKKKMVEYLITAKEKAEESDRLKSAFLANMSHEIRTPMNGILGFTELLLEPDLSSGQREQFIEIVHKSGQRMLNTVTDIIEMSKIEAGIVNISFKVTDVNSKLEELVTFFKQEASQKGLKLSLKKVLSEQDKNLLADTNMLNSIISNLIKNAIKYTNSGFIEVGCSKKDDFIEFYIKDTGIGIPEDRIEAIFERFIQADIADTRAFQGSGLGLTISKSYVEMLGGKIWVESREGEGSTFYFTLPSGKIMEEEISGQGERFLYSANGKTKATFSGLKILIAEDEDLSYIYISSILKDYCREILKAQTGIETVELCKNNPDIDLVLMDIKMPDMNGYAATGKIREFNKEVIIIAQTAFALSGDREKAIGAGCNDYITKPTKKEVLIKLIAKYFHN
jgi:hypothetical protein